MCRLDFVHEDRSKHLSATGHPALLEPSHAVKVESGVHEDIGRY